MGVFQSTKTYIYKFEFSIKCQNVFISNIYFRPTTATTTARVTPKKSTKRIGTGTTAHPPLFPKDASKARVINIVDIRNKVSCYVHCKDFLKILLCKNFKIIHQIILASWKPNIEKS